MSEFSLAALVAERGCRVVVELGTGDGATAARVMGVLHPHGAMYTVNWPNPPSGDNPMRYLAPWAGDYRLVLIFGDTCDPAVVARIPREVDLLFIDSTHTRECADAEWAAYRPKLADGATVVVDDLNHGDMQEFWDSVPYDKYTVGTVGVFRYDAVAAPTV